ncbi:hypothetical protein C0585_04205 [Candidatus Woesearchaeota archaeon]|nr:MAG: hypothetical protein C0585_04205 [Candidatus Woesearchaeota archaeon]
MGLVFNFRDDDFLKLKDSVIEPKKTINYSSDILKGIFYFFPEDRSSFIYETGRFQEFFDKRKSEDNILRTFRPKAAYDSLHISNLITYPHLGSNQYTFSEKCREMFPKDYFKPQELNELEKISLEFQEEFGI